MKEFLKIVNGKLVTIIMTNNEYKKQLTNFENGKYSELATYRKINGKLYGYLYGQKKDSELFSVANI